MLGPRKFLNLYSAEKFDPSNPTGSGYSLSFSDDFPGAALNGANWTSDGWPWSPGSGLNTGTYINDESIAGNVTVANSICSLAITDTVSPGGKPFSTSLIHTYGKFSQKYGYWSARLKMPNSINGAANGLFPAFWLVTNDPASTWPPEIDIIEWLGTVPSLDHTTLHYGPVGVDIYHSQVNTTTNLSSDFHTYGLLWTPGRITWYLDNIKLFSITKIGTTTVPMSIILNNNTGAPSEGLPNGYKNFPDASTIYPGIFQIDWVKVYSSPI